jgi:hypothetical protein
VDVDAGEKVCSYYFADRAERTLFWLHELGTGDLFDGVRGVNEPSHIREFMNHVRMPRSQLNSPTQGMRFNFSTGECRSFVSGFSTCMDLDTLLTARIFSAMTQPGNCVTTGFIVSSTRAIER